ncbi:MAG: LacI family DNA-binding transcriptional regulator [Acidobacteriaceae bacterium]|nr:LacI family DNA-binding transcriptional regulator [Acidobacteriaceae bacterium]
MAVRLKDIARDLGVSVVTVSKVLRNHEDISTETRDRVLKRMKELNYQPNLAARALVTGRSHLMGLVVPDLVHPFFAQVAKGVSSVLRNRGYGLVIASSEEDPDLERQEIGQMLARRLDGLLIASTQWTVESFRKIEEQQRPYVLVDRKFNGLPANFVGSDDVAIGRMATTHLLENGCKRLAYIGGEHVSTAIERLEGFRGALTSAGLPISNEYIVCRPHYDDAGDVTGYKAAKELLALTSIPDGIFCNNDPLAMGVMDAILEAGLRIPEDICIIGAGNVRYAGALRVPLSSIDQDSALLGSRSAELALSLVQAKTPQRPKQIIIPPQLVVRQSSMRSTVQAGRP